MASRFRLQIIDTRDGEVVEFHPGSRVESEFIDDIVNRTMAKGVGLFRSTAHVKDDLRTSIEEAILDLKKKVRP